MPTMIPILPVAGFRVNVVSFEKLCILTFRVPIS